MSTPTAELTRGEEGKGWGLNFEGVISVYYMYMLGGPGGGGGEPRKFLRSFLK